MQLLTGTGPCRWSHQGGPRSPSGGRPRQALLDPHRHPQAAPLHRCRPRREEVGGAQGPAEVRRECLGQEARCAPEEEAVERLREVQGHEAEEAGRFSAVLVTLARGALMHLEPVCATSNNITNIHQGPLRGPEDLRQDPRLRKGISSFDDVGRHGVVEVAACRCRRRHDVHFLSITKATYGILKFKTWIGCIISMIRKVQFGWEG